VTSIQFVHDFALVAGGVITGLTIAYVIGHIVRP
jgi:hypothetical protein